MCSRNAVLALCAVAVGCVDPQAECAALGEAACPDGQQNGEVEAVYCEDYYEGSCSSEWDAYVQCAKETPICFDGEALVYPCKAEEVDHGRCLCEVESEHGWSPWCDIYGK